MDTVKQEALDHCWNKIVDDLNITHIVDHLRTLLTSEDIDIINLKETSHSQSRELIDILKRKEEKKEPFECLLEALRSKVVSQAWLADQIQTKYNELHQGQQGTANAIPARHPSAHHTTERPDRQALRQFRHEICHDLQMDELMNILESREVVTSAEREKINAEKTDLEKREKLIDILLTKGPEAFNVFIEALATTGQQHIVQHLKNAETLKND